MKNTFHNHGYKTQSKLWKQFPKLVACIISPLMRDNSTSKLQHTSFLKFGSHYRKFAMYIIPSAASRQRRDNSTCKFQCTLFLKLGSHYNNRGIALITVILIVSILVAVAIELNRSSRVAIYDAANLSDGIKLTYIAKSGFYGAAAMIANSNNNYDTLRDNWAKTEILSVQSQTLFTDGHFMTTVEDEAGKIPLNKLVNGNEYNPAIKEILIRLLGQPEFGLDERKANEIADSIKDWIDVDNSITGYGAETSYYSSLDPPYEAKNAPLDCIEELLMVKGITKEIFYGTKEKPGLAGFVTADSDGAININTAPKMVLRSLSAGISAELADRIDEYRRKEGNDLSSPQWYNRVSGMAGVNISPELIMLKSNYFKIISVGTMKNMEQSLSGVVKRSGQKSVQIIKWRQD
jgi:general secretion pathway protein K